MTSRKCLGLYLGILLSAFACGSSDDEDGAIQSETERLMPAPNVCVKSDACPYGHCSIEDGVCNQSPACTPGAACAGVCYGTCVVTPRPPAQ